jgi:2-polyprenyl-6-hydroxyphenyl methylase/3-demethylubiquinone-9 3-methyltransferase
MSKWHDIVDWIGGYPFEVSKPDRIFDRCHARGFELTGLRTVGGSLACNEFLFVREARRAA